MADVIDPKAKQPQKSTGFTNINDVVKANRMNRLGQTVSSGVSGIVGQNQQQLGQSKSQFQQEAQKNTMGGEADKQFVQGALADPTKSDQGTVDKFAQFRGGQYQGPQELANKEQLQAGAQNLQGLAQASRDEYGRRGLLQRFVSPTNQYTQGQQRLDNLLLGQTGGQALGQARREANLYGRDVSEAERAAQAQAQGLSGQARQFGEFVNKRLGEEETGLQSSIDKRVAEQKAEAENARAGLAALFTKAPEKVAPKPGEMTTQVMPQQQKISQQQYEAAKRLLEKQGIGSEAGYGLENFLNSPEELIGQGIIDPTRQSVSSEDDKARALALGRLSGKQSQLYSEADKVGGYDPGSFLNKENLEKARKRGQDIYDPAVKQKQASEKRLSDLEAYEKDIRSLGGKSNEDVQRQLETIQREQVPYLKDDPRYQQYMEQRQSQISPLEAELQRRQELNLRNRQLGLSLGEDEFKFGGGDYGQLMAGRMETAKGDIAKQKALEEKYNANPLLERLKGLIG